MLFRAVDDLAVDPKPLGTRLEFLDESRLSKKERKHRDGDFSTYLRQVQTLQSAVDFFGWNGTFRDWANLSGINTLEWINTLLGRRDETISGQRWGALRTARQVLYEEKERIRRLRERRDKHRACEVKPSATRGGLSKAETTISAEVYGGESEQLVEIVIARWHENNAPERVETSSRHQGQPPVDEESRNGIGTGDA